MTIVARALQKNFTSGRNGEAANRARGSKVDFGGHELAGSVRKHAIITIPSQALR